jgi:hypothetical protein
VESVIDCEVTVVADDVVSTPFNVKFPPRFVIGAIVISVPNEVLINPVGVNLVTHLSLKIS